MAATNLTANAVLVTGAGSGIGRATALAFARDRAKLAICDIDAKGVKETVELITASTDDVLAAVIDVSSEAEVDRMVAEVLARFGGLNAAVNCAGIEGPDDRVADLALADFDQVLRVNLSGTFLCLRGEIRAMREQSRGSIVNIASIAGKVGLRGKAAYAASKHGIIGLTKTAALEYARAGIRVNAICPGAIDTPLLDRGLGGSAAARQQLANSLPAGRIASAAEVAAAALWLCSDGASYVTGHTLVVDGGFLAQ